MDHNLCAGVEPYQLQVKDEPLRSHWIRQHCDCVPWWIFVCIWRKSKRWHFLQRRPVLTCGICSLQEQLWLEWVWVVTNLQMSAFICSSVLYKFVCWMLVISCLKCAPSCMKTVHLWLQDQVITVGVIEDNSENTKVYKLLLLLKIYAFINPFWSFLWKWVCLLYYYTS